MEGVGRVGRAQVFTLSLDPAESVESLRLPHLINERRSGVAEKPDVLRECDDSIGMKIH